MAKKDKRKYQKPAPTVQPQPVAESTAFRIDYSSHKTRAIILALFAFLLYFNTVRNDYSVDDNFVVNEMTEKGFAGIKEVFTSNWASQDGKGITYRAISRASIALEKGAFSAGPGLHHFFNIVYFIISLLLTYRFLLSVLGKKYSGLIFFALLLFTAHPIHVEVVASLKSRDELFSYLFGIIFCHYGFKFYREGNIFHLLIATISIIVAWMSKEGAPQYIPVMLLTCLIFAKLNYRKFIPLTLICLGVCALYIFFHINFITRETTEVAASEEIRLVFVEAQLKNLDNFSERYGTSFYGMLYYIRLLLFPFPLSFFYGYQIIPIAKLTDPLVILSILIYLGLFLYAVTYIKKLPVVAYLILFYLSSLAVFSTLVIPINGVVADRHIYMGSLPFCILFMMLLFKLAKIPFDSEAVQVTRKYYFFIPFLVLTGILSAKTVQRNSEWKDRLTISGIDAERNPRSGMAHLYYAVELQRKLHETGDSADLVPKIMKHQQAYIDIYAFDPVPYVRIGNLYWTYYNNPQLAESYLNKALELGPKSPYIYYTISRFYEQTADTLKHRLLMDKMRIELPDAYEPYLFYGISAFKSNRIEEAVIWFEKALSLGCTDPEMVRFLKDYYIQLGQFGKLSDLQAILNRTASKK